MYKKKKPQKRLFLFGADDGNRTRNTGLGSRSFTTELHPQSVIHYTFFPGNCQPIPEDFRKKYSYKPHEYYTNDSFESVWVHISGGNSFDLFEEMERNSGNLVKCKDIQHVQDLLFRIFDRISGNNPSTEIGMYLDIYKLFAELLNMQMPKAREKAVMKKASRKSKNTFRRI